MLSLVLIACAGAQAADNTAFSDRSWGTHLHDAERTNSAPGALTLPPAREWTKSIASVFSLFRVRPQAEFVTSPAVYKGSIYVGSKDGRFYAFDLDSGKDMWKFKPASGVDGPATASEGMVCFGSIEGVLYCVQRESGREIWRFKARSEITSSPVIADERVYFSSSDDRVYALDKSAGEKIWTYTHNSASYVASRLDASPAVWGGRLYVMFNDGWLVCLDSRTGAEVWKKDVLNGNMLTLRGRRTPYLYEGLVYVIDDKGWVIALDAVSGEEKARYDIVRAVDFIVTKKDIYIAGHELLVALGRPSGRISWTAELSHGEPYSMAFSEGHIFVLSNFASTPFDIRFLERDHGYIAAYTADGGAQTWGVKLRETVHSSVALASNHIALVTTNGVLHVFGTANTPASTD